MAAVIGMGNEPPEHDEWRFSVDQVLAFVVFVVAVSVVLVVLSRA